MSGGVNHVNQCQGGNDSVVGGSDQCRVGQCVAIENGYSTRVVMSDKCSDHPVVLALGDGNQR